MWVALTVVVTLAVIVVVLGWRITRVYSDARRALPANASRALATGSGARRSLLVIGDDSRTDRRGNADAILLLLYGGDHRPAVVSVERDVVLDGRDGADRGATIYAHDGPGALITAVSRTLDVPINDAAIVRFGDARRLVDDIGGVRVDNPNSFITVPFDGGPWWFRAGRVELDGRHALAYARARATSERTSASGESERLRRQQQVLAALADAFGPADVLRHPFDRTRAMGRAAASSLSARDALALAWQLRDSVARRCRIGGRRAFIRTGVPIAGGTLVPRRDGLLVVARAADVHAVMRMAVGDEHPRALGGGEHPSGCHGGG
jgi:LCP family protein required for cell wall assembly